MPPNSSTKCEVTSWTGEIPETPQTQTTPGTTSTNVPQTTRKTISEVPETSQTKLAPGTTLADALSTSYLKWGEYLRAFKVVETSFFDEPANEFRGSTWQTPPKGLPTALSAKDRQVIDILVSAQKDYQEVPEVYLEKVQPFPRWKEENGETKKDKLMRFNHIAELTHLQLMLSKAFCRRLPGIREIPLTDLFKLCEENGEVVLFVRYARKYDRSIDAVRVVSGAPPYTQEHFRHLHRTKAIKALFHLFRTKMAALRLDEVEYALFQAIVFFRNCPHLEQPQLVTKHCKHYSRILREYMQATPSRWDQLVDAWDEMDSLKGNMRRPPNLPFIS